MTRGWTTAAATAAILVGATLNASAARADSPSCGRGWGSQDKVAASSGAGSSRSMTDVRAGRHACFDRLVLTLAGDGAARVRYVDAVHAEGTGDVVALRGAADLEIITGPMYDVETGAPTYLAPQRSELVDAHGFRTLRQVASGGSFEGQSTLGVGVRSRLPFRVFGLAGPGGGSRLVIDIAHRW